MSVLVVICGEAVWVSVRYGCGCKSVWAGCRYVGECLWECGCVYMGVWLGVGTLLSLHGCVAGCRYVGEGLRVCVWVCVSI